jgi:hypothetical protein
LRYGVTLGRTAMVERIAHARKHRQLPVILSADEITRFFAAVPSLKHRTALMTAYAAGLRVSEVVHLKITDIDRSRMLIRVEQGKGGRDRYIMLSPRRRRTAYSTLLIEPVRPHSAATLGEERLEPGVEAQDREPAFAGQGLYPVAALYARWLCEAEVDRRGAVGVRLGRRRRIALTACTRIALRRIEHRARLVVVNRKRPEFSAGCR